ncbi:hypothetical protein VPH35_014191 [Triticum aestivum]
MVGADKVSEEETAACVGPQGQLEDKRTPPHEDREQLGSPQPEGAPSLPMLETQSEMPAGEERESVENPTTRIGEIVELAPETMCTLAPTKESMCQEERDPPASETHPIIAANGASSMLHGLEDGTGLMDGNHARSHTHARSDVAGAIVQPDPRLSVAAETVELGAGELALSLAAIREDADDADARKQEDLAALTKGMTSQEAVAFAKLKAFCTNIVKRLAPPLLKEVQASARRTDAEPCTPRRTTRASKRSTSVSVTRATPAKNVLLRALGLVSADLVPHEEDVQELKELFDSPLRDQHVCIIAALFGKPVPSFDADGETRMVVEAH